MKSFNINLDKQYSNLCTKIYRKQTIYSSHYYNHTVLETNNFCYVFDLNKEVLHIEHSEKRKEFYNNILKQKN